MTRPTRTGVSPRPTAPIASALRIAALYAAFGIPWILLSDRLVARMPHEDLLQSIKGVLFILVSCLVLLAAVWLEARRNAQLADVLALERRRLASHITGANLGTWEWNAETGETVFNERWAEMFGYTLEEVQPVSIDTWRRLAHPEDLARSDALLEAHFNGESDYYVCDVRVRHKDGHWVWVSDRGRVISRDVRGRPLLVSGIHTDVTESKGIKQRLLETAARHSAVIDSIADGLIVYDADGRVRSCNRAAERILGLSAEEILDRSNVDPRWETVRPDGSPFPAAERPSARTLATGEAVERALLGLQRPGGSLRWLEVSTSPLRISDDSTPTGVVMTFTDVTRRREAEQQLRVAATAFHTQTGILVCDAEGTIVRVNPAFSRITGYSSEEVVGRNPRLLESGLQDEAFYQRMWAEVRTHGHFEGELWNRRKNGEVYPQWLLLSAITDESGRISHYVGGITDITERKEAESRIHELAYFDSLTGLANRRLLLDRLAHAADLAGRSGTYDALLLIDLDHFKVLNDTRGHPEGDRILRAVAGRLRELAAPGDTIARLGGDEFVVLIESLDASAERAGEAARAHAEHLIEALRRPHTLSCGARYRLAASLGVTVFRGSGHEAEEILKQADVALYEAKGAGRDCARFFDPAMQRSLADRSRIEGELRRSLDQDELRLYFQPKVTADGSLAGAEALLRWQHPERGLLAPGHFIAVAEDSGLIVPVGYWVMERACENLAKWARDPRHHGLGLSVNVSPRQFSDPDFLTRLVDVLRRTGAPAQNLTLEITENVILEPTDELLAKLMRIRRLGVRFSLDDFGTGYSSLANLRHLPVSEVKIDASFVRDTPADANDCALVRTILLMGEAMGVEVVAEGVEYEAQHRFLSDNGCRAYQGYLFGRPLPAERFIEKYIKPTRPVLRAVRT